MEEDANVNRYTITGTGDGTLYEFGRALGRVESGERYRGNLNPSHVATIVQGLSANMIERVTGTLFVQRVDDVTFEYRLFHLVAIVEAAKPKPRAAAPRETRPASMPCPRCHTYCDGDCRF
jgi:hypothetical protein